MRAHRVARVPKWRVAHAFAQSNLACTDTIEPDERPNLVGKRQDQANNDAPSNPATVHSSMWKNDLWTTPSFFSAAPSAEGILILRFGWVSTVAVHLRRNLTDFDFPIFSNNSTTLSNVIFRICCIFSERKLVFERCRFFSLKDTLHFRARAQFRIVHLDRAIAHPMSVCDRLRNLVW